MHLLVYPSLGFGLFLFFVFRDALHINLTLSMPFPLSDFDWSFLYIHTYAFNLFDEFPTNVTTACPCPCGNNIIESKTMKIPP